MVDAGTAFSLLWIVDADEFEHLLAFKISNLRPYHSKGDNEMGRRNVFDVGVEQLLSYPRYTIVAAATIRLAI